MNNQEWWFSVQDELEEKVYSIFRPARIDFTNCEHIDAACMLIMGCIILADWIASSHWFDKVKNDSDNEEYYKSILNIAEQVVT